ncbi:MAG: SOS response-associated peptidase [Hyphomicrobiaceae bacterium]
MCNLYSMTTNREAVLRLFRVGDNRAEAFKPATAIFPSQVAPVVRNSDDGTRELVHMSWGFVFPQTSKAARRVTNARDDKVLTSNFWRSSFEERRCLVPVTSFCEPKGRAPASWHWFGLDRNRSTFAFAGIWRSFKGHLKLDAPPVEIETYAFLTTSPNELVREVHPTRMPAMLVGQDAMDCWVDGSTADATALIAPYPADTMMKVQVGPDREDRHGAGGETDELRLL